ncbi:MAG: ABC transporter ATP-binding protein [Anaerococcus sp.]|nr:ABC transporter ATP-binding protein [Anaerococcus sp.]
MNIECNNISKKYQRFKGPVFKNVSLSLKDNERAIITGPSGSGKTTLLKILALIDRSFKGDYLLDEKNIRKINSKDLAELRKNISYVFQEYGLLENESVYENISLGLTYTNLSKKNIDTKINKITKFLEINDLLKNKVGLLSGGQRQRVALARAMVRNSNIFIADEPFSALDLKMTKKIMSFLLDHYENKILILSFHEKPSFIDPTFKNYIIKDKTLTKI